MDWQQLLLTPYNLGLYDGQWNGDGPAGWMVSRFRVFRRFCAPSVAAQTAQQFLWIVFCDSRTPMAEIQRLRGTLPDNSSIALMQSGREGIHDVVAEYLDRRRPYLVTTHLASDECLRRDTIAVLEKECRPPAPVLIDCPLRLNYDPLAEKASAECPYERGATNRFLALLEKMPETGPPTTVCAPAEAPMQTMARIKRISHGPLSLRVLGEGEGASSITRVISRIPEHFIAEPPFPGNHR